MKKTVFLLLIVCCPVICFAQAPGGGIQFSGILSANFIDDFNSNTAYFDNNGGYTYIQLDGSLKEGAFGLDSQLQFGPSGTVAGVTQVNTLFFHYGYGYANFFDGGLYLAVGRFVDMASFGLNSYFQQGPDGPGVYGGLPGKAGSTGFGVNGIELRTTPLQGLLLGLVLPYNIDPFPIVKNTLLGVKLNVSYTVEKTIQFVVGYQQHQIGVSDYVSTSNAFGDINTLAYRNKLFALANLLVSEDLVAGARWELDHDVSAVQVISNNAYITLGGKIGSFSIGGDAGFYYPPGGTPGFEVLAATSYTFKNIGPSIDLQPYLAAGFFNSNYPVVSFEYGVAAPDLNSATPPSAYILNGANYINVNPQLKLLLGRSQHELVLGYSITFDLDHMVIAFDQVNLMMQVYF